MEDLYDRLCKNIPKKAFMELMIGKMILEEINKILDEKDIENICTGYDRGHMSEIKQKNSEDGNLVKKLLKYLEDQNGPAIFDGTPEKTVHEEEQVLKKITASDANRKIIPISEGCRTGENVNRPVKLRAIQGGGSSYRRNPGKRSSHPHLKLITINNPPTTTYDPDEAA